MSAASVAPNQIPAGSIADDPLEDPLVETAINAAPADAAVDPASSAAEQQTLEYTIMMTCGGCSGAIERTLKKLEGKGVVEHNVSLEAKTALVTIDNSLLSYEDLTEKLRKTGKKIIKVEDKGTGVVTEFSS